MRFSVRTVLAYIMPFFALAAWALGRNDIDLPLQDRLEILFAASVTLLVIILMVRRPLGPWF
jgi:hypothetical protein